MKIPTLSTEQMREVDRLMTGTYHISLLQMMENAGRSLAEQARHMLGGSLVDKVIFILCGSGNNGGGGMVAARHLHNWGAQVHLRIAGDPAGLKDVPAQQWRILKSLGLDQGTAALKPGDLVIDALLGYGISGDPSPSVARVINWANEQSAPVLALDTPSGLDTTSGIAHDPTVRATVTLTLALPKTGLLIPAARKYVGKLYLADIGVPAELYQSAFGLRVPPIFGEHAIIQA
jgi:NAD(P)H-hydrate epimerase